MTNSEKLKSYIDSFYDWQEFRIKRMSPELHATIVQKHQKLIDALDKYLLDRRVHEPDHNEPCFGVQDLTPIGKWKFINDYWYDQRLGKFVSNIGDNDPYGYVVMWVSCSVIDTLTEKEFDEIIR
jgi:hypothetical protein